MSRYKKKPKHGSSETNRYFRTDIPLIAPDGLGELRPRISGFAPYTAETAERIARLTTLKLGTDRLAILRGNRQFGYHSLSLMVKKEYGDVQAALEEMVAVDVEWKHGPFITFKDGEYHTEPFIPERTKLGGGIVSTPAEVVESKNDEPEKVAFSWSTTLY